MTCKICNGSATTEINEKYRALEWRGGDSHVTKIYADGSREKIEFATSEEAWNFWDKGGKIS